MDQLQPSRCSLPTHGISAVKAIQLAVAEGQKIWTITQANLSTALAEINLPRDVESDIRNSVFSGMEVTAHERAVDFFGSSKVGYIVLNPETGAGGYLIGGGEMGAAFCCRSRYFGYRSDWFSGSITRSCDQPTITCNRFFYCYSHHFA